MKQAQYVPGYGWVSAEEADEIDRRDAWEELFNKPRKADWLLTHRELLCDIRDLLWRYREFCPEAVELRIRVSDALDMLEDVREVRVK